MYKFYFSVALIFCLTFAPNGIYLDRLAEELSATEYFFYISGECESGGDIRTVKNGEDDIVLCPPHLANSARNKIKGIIKGESFRFAGDINSVKDIVNRLNAKVVRTSFIDGIYIVYLYSGAIRATPLTLYGERVNVQIALSQKVVSVGVPLILGGY